MKKNNQYGGAAMEYILVTTFATVVTMGALGVIGKTIKLKLDKVTESLEGDDAFNPFEQP
jgi:Flp pilus assembly pilin Flp